MSIIRLDQSKFQNYTIVANPSRKYEFVSGSECKDETTVGDVPVFIDASKVLKDIDPTFAEDGYDSSGILKLHAEAIEDSLESFELGGDKNIFSTVEAYMDAVRRQPMGDRQAKRQIVRRYEPGVKLDKNFLSKSIIKNNLFSYYSKVNPGLDWSYTNYNCLNFVSGNTVSNDAAIIYRATNSSVVDEDIYPVETQIFIEFPLQTVIFFSNQTREKYYIIFSNSPSFSLNYSNGAKSFYVGLDPNSPISGDFFKEQFEVLAEANGLKIFVTSISQQVSMDFGLDHQFTIDAGKISNLYAPYRGFTFDFWIKPKTPQLSHLDSVSAGTILHMSSCYAISLITGSSRGPDGLADRYKILLQLSQSAEIPPSAFYFNDDGDLTTDSEIDSSYAWVSSDNSLVANDWNHVNISWAGKDSNSGRAAITINGTVNREFFITDEEIMQVYVNPQVSSDPDVLILGNFFEGNNKDLNSQQGFFNLSVSNEQGLSPYSFDSDPLEFEMKHPLNAELHDIKIYDRAVLSHEILNLSKFGREKLDDGLLFYLPVLFTKQSRQRRVLQTPFQWFQGSTEDPFNVALSFGVGGYELNLENFVREFVTGEYPRLYKMFTPQRENPAVEEGLTSNDLMYGHHCTEGPSEDLKIARRRLYSILPCDNGNFRPSYSLLNDTLDPNFYASYFLDKSKISLDDLVPLDSVFASIQTPADLGGEESNFISQIFNISPERPGEPGLSATSPLTVLRRTMDPSSNEIVIFDISNLFYGDRILPNSLVMTDSDPYLLDGRDNCILKDDGLGKIYRANSVGKKATWNCIGNVLYDEGLIIIKSPHVRFFGKTGFKIEFRGERNIHVLEVSIPIDYNQCNVSNNPTYKRIKPSRNANELSEKFTYVTGINLHDDNLNIIGRANLAQPVVKRDEDKFVIKLRMDF